jgi:hypothetical protein
MGIAYPGISMEQRNIAEQPGNRDILPTVLFLRERFFPTQGREHITDGKLTVGFLPEG